MVFVKTCKVFIFFQFLYKNINVFSNNWLINFLLYYVFSHILCLIKYSVYYVRCCYHVARISIHKILIAFS